MHEYYNTFSPFVVVVFLFNELYCQKNHFVIKKIITWIGKNKFDEKHFFYIIVHIIFSMNIFDNHMSK